MILGIDTNRLLVVFNRRYSLSEFQAASQVAAGTYADELVARIYNCLFRHPRDLRAEYANYYAVEYSDFAEFLYWKYNVGGDMLRRIQGRITTNDFFIGYGKDTIGLFTDETGASILNQILFELGEKENENTD